MATINGITYLDCRDCNGSGWQSTRNAFARFQCNACGGSGADAYDVELTTAQWRVILKLSESRGVCHAKDLGPWRSSTIKALSVAAGPDRPVAVRIDGHLWARGVGAAPRGDPRHEGASSVPRRGARPVDAGLSPGDARRARPGRRALAPEREEEGS